MAGSARPGTLPTRSGRRARRGSRPHIIDETLFSRVVTKERHRSDRTKRPLALLIVTLRDPLVDDVSSLWGAIIDALMTATRDIDIVGWFDHSLALGVAVAGIGGEDPLEACRAIQARVRREL